MTTEVEAAAPVSLEVLSDDEQTTQEPSGESESDTTEASGAEEPKGPAREYLTLSPHAGYVRVATLAVYVHESATEAGYTVPNLLGALQAHAKKASMVVDTNVTKNKSGRENGTFVYIDTEASAAAAKVKGREPKAAKPATMEDLPKILRFINASKLDKDFIAAHPDEAERLSAARTAACEKYGLDESTLQALFAQYLGATA